MDILGKAISDYFNYQQKQPLWINNTYGEPEEMPVDVFFRDIEDMPELEVVALKQCRGKILDIGAGAGSHALYLQEQNKQVTALEISPLAVEVMQSRGVKQVICADIFELSPSETYDTLLLLMNGIGLAGDLAGLQNLLLLFKRLIKPGGQLLFDSSDIRYLYQDLPLPTDAYYGILKYQYQYGKLNTEWFNWLYVDQQQLSLLAAQTGWNVEVIFEDDFDQYLAKLTLMA